MAIEDNSPSLKSDFALLESDEPVVGSEQEVEEKPAKIEKPKVEKPKAETIPSDEEDDDEQQQDEQDEDEEDKVKDTGEDEEEETKELLPHERPTLSQIKEKFPDFFKQFPTLKDAFFREKQFSEVFHTPQEAREASEAVGEYNTLREDIVNGTGETLLPALKESDSLGKFSKNFLPNLFKLDKDLHWQTVLPIIEDIVRIAYADGNKNGNENLKWGAYYVAQHILGDPEVAEGKKTLVQEDKTPKSDPKVNKEQQEYENRRYNDFNIDIHESIYNSLVNEINKGFKDNEGLTKFMKDSIVKAIIDKVSSTVKADKEFSRYKDRLWKDAKSNGYRSDDKSRIINASLARAKSLVPSIRRGLIAEALGSSPSENGKKLELVERQNSRKEPGSSGRDASVRTRTPSAKGIDWSKTSDMDFLNDNYVPKGQKKDK